MDGSVEHGGMGLKQLLGFGFFDHAGTVESGVDEVHCKHTYRFRKALEIIPILFRYL